MIGKKSIISIAIVVCAIWWRNVKQYSPIVEISSGKLLGIKSDSRDGREFFEFLNIPYAKAPIGLLRYEAPEEVEKWDNIKDSTSYGPPCIQINLFLGMVEGHEDCLALNIHTPKISDGKSTDLMPVIVFIHGGIFVFGSGILYRPEYFMDHNVVFVTINYRLGSFGFLNTGDGVVRGNMGLKDQNMALRWVQENIIHFGGDPNKVTIFGESAGGASVQYHLVSPMSRGLFQKAITQSGSVLYPWALFDKPKEQSNRFAEMLNCTTASSIPKSNLPIDVNCLKSLPAEEIMKVHLECVNPLHEPISFFVPTLEVDIQDGKTFLSEHPKEILKSGNYSKVPIIAGVNSHEGLTWTAAFVRNETAMKLAVENWEKYFPRAVYLPDDIAPEILKKIEDFYFQGKNLTLTANLSELEDLTNLFGDRTCKVEFQNSAEILVNGSMQSSPVFLYFYSYESEFTLLDSIIEVKGEYDPRLEILYSMIKTWIKENVFGEKPVKYGVSHADEMLMQLPLNLPLTPFVQKDNVDYKFSKEFVKLWVDFSKSPNEVAELKFMGQSWPSQVPGKSLEFFQIDSKPRLISSPFQESVDFWNSLEIY